MINPLQPPSSLRSLSTSSSMMTFDPEPPSVTSSVLQDMVTSPETSNQSYIVAQDNITVDEFNKLINTKPGLLILKSNSWSANVETSESRTVVHIHLQFIRKERTKRCSNYFPNNKFSLKKANEMIEPISESPQTSELSTKILEAHDELEKLKSADDQGAFEAEQTCCWVGRLKQAEFNDFLCSFCGLLMLKKESWSCQNRDQTFTLGLSFFPAILGNHNPIDFFDKKMCMSFKKTDEIRPPQNYNLEQDLLKRKIYTAYKIWKEEKTIGKRGQPPKAKNNLGVKEEKGKTHLLDSIMNVGPALNNDGLFSTAISQRKTTMNLPPALNNDGLLSTAISHRKTTSSANENRFLTTNQSQKKEKLDEQQNKNTLFLESFCERLDAISKIFKKNKLNIAQEEEEKEEAEEAEAEEEESEEVKKSLETITEVEQEEESSDIEENPNKKKVNLIPKFKQYNEELVTDPHEVEIFRKIIQDFREIKASDLPGTAESPPIDLFVKFEDQEIQAWWNGLEFRVKKAMWGIFFTEGTTSYWENLPKNRFVPEHLRDYRKKNKRKFAEFDPQEAEEDQKKRALRFLKPSEEGNSKQILEEKLDKIEERERYDELEKKTREEILLEEERRKKMKAIIENSRSKK